MTKLRHLFGDQADLIDSLLDAVDAANDARLAAGPDRKREVIDTAAPLRDLTRKLAVKALQTTEVRVLQQCPHCGHREETQS